MSPDEFEARLASVETTAVLHKARMDQFSNQLEINTSLTQNVKTSVDTIKTNTDTLIDILTTARGVVKFLRFLAGAGKIFTGIVAAVALGYFIITGNWREMFGLIK